MGPCSNNVKVVSRRSHDMYIMNYGEDNRRGQRANDDTTRLLTPLCRERYMDILNKYVQIAGGPYLQLFVSVWFKKWRLQGFQCSEREPVGAYANPKDFKGLLVGSPCDSFIISAQNWEVLLAMVKK